MAQVEQKVLTAPTFINGSLHPAGAIVGVDMDQFVDEDGNKVSDKKAFPNLADVGQAAVLVPSEIAPIGPTGPAPRRPQQLPAGTLETPEGFVNGGAVLIAEGHPEARGMIEGAQSLNEGVEEEAVQRLNDTAQASGTAGTNGSETGTANAAGTGEPFTGDDGFDADGFINRNLDDISDEDIAALSPKQLDRVIAAENDREKPRKTLLTRLGVTE